jgi:hypothetical protein
MSKMKKFLTLANLATGAVNANRGKPAVKSIVLGAQKNAITEGVPGDVNYDIAATGIDIGNGDGVITVAWYDAAGGGNAIPEPEGLENFGYTGSSSRFFLILWDNSAAGDCYFTVTFKGVTSNRAKLTVGSADLTASSGLSALITKTQSTLSAASQSDRSGSAFGTTARVAPTRNHYP